MLTKAIFVMDVNGDSDTDNMQRIAILINSSQKTNGTD